MDELMGKERDLEEHVKTNKVRHFTDDDVCKYYLAGVSPYALFKNTKSDMGAYEKEFDDECKAAFEALPQSEKDKYGYEYDLMIFLDTLVSGCDQKVQRHMSRIKQEHDQV